MSTLYIRLPSKHAADSATQWLELVCPFVLVSRGSEIEREGTMPLSGMTDLVAKAQRVVLLLAASDVTLLHVQVPPLSPAKLKAALPNLVEDQLLSDPASCLVAANGLSNGLRMVAVVQHAWLDLLAKKFFSFGAYQIAAIPAQLCLPRQQDQYNQPGSITAAINEQAGCIDVALRLSEQNSIGLVINVDQNEIAAQEVINALCVVAPKAQISLYVPQSVLQVYQEQVNNADALNARVGVLADNWQYWIAGARDTTLDLMAWRGVRVGSRMWREWRWSLALIAVTLSINIAALNIDWWRMNREEHSLRARMIQIYKSVYPKENVIIDPIAQMRQKIALARNSSMTAPDNFMTIIAIFSEEWAKVTSTSAAGSKASAIAALEYREHGLFVRFKPDSEAPMQAMAAALAKHNLSLNMALGLAPEQSGTIIWQIRSIK